MKGTDFRLGEWVVRPQRCCIESAGKSVHVKPKSMAVLERLAHANGAVVPRNDILDAVWPGAAVTDDVLTQCVTELRKAFGDTPQDPRVIETVPKMGLRLMIEVEWPDSPVSEDQVPRRSVPGALRIGLLIAAAIVIGVIVWPYLSDTDESGFSAVSSDEKSIAVLPFVDMSEAKDQAHLANGLAEELTNRLSHLEGLRVLGRRTALTVVQGVDLDLRALRDRLSVDYLLDGSIRRSGDQLRIVSQLIDTRDGSQVWSHSFEREYADVFAIQDYIAVAVADTLSVKLAVGDPRTRTGGTSNAAAYEQVLLGNAAAFPNEGLIHYQRAVDLDPDYATAWMRIAVAYSDMWRVAGKSDIDLQRKLARDARDRALALAPDSHEVLLMAAGIEQDWIESKRLYERAKALHVQYEGAVSSRSWMSQFYVYRQAGLGYMTEVLQLHEYARRVEPMLPRDHNFHGMVLFSQQRIDDALEELERGDAIDVWSSDTALMIALWLDDIELIDYWMGRAVANEGPGAMGAFTAMQERLYDRERALTWLHDAYESSPGYDYFVIVWASYYGDDDLALKAMRRSMDMWVFWIPLTAHLRRTAEFKSIARDEGLVDYWREFGWNDFCQPLGDDDFECR